MPGAADLGGRGYRSPAPEPSARVVWPAGFGTRYFVSVDTEEEFDWSKPLARAGHGLSALAALSAAQQRFAALGIPLASMVDYPVAADRDGAALLRDLLAAPGAAVGAQLHAWNTPPFSEALSPANSFAGNLPEAIEAAKIDAITAALEAATGLRPRAFRAGRYGIGPRTLGLLAARGYRLDSSMRARHEYRAEGGPDFRAIGAHAFRCGPGQTMVELPLTTVFVGALRRHGARLHPLLGRVPKGRGVFARAGLLSRVPLTPEGVPFAEAAEAVRVALGEGVAVLNFAFHSPSLVPGHTPYVRDAADLARFWRWWEEMAALLDQLGVRAVGLDALLAAL